MLHKINFHRGLYKNVFQLHLVPKHLFFFTLHKWQGSYFLQDTVNRPGFAKFFLESASEERQHALKLMEYLLMRGELTTTVEFDKLIDNPVSEKWSEYKIIII